MTQLTLSFFGAFQVSLDGRPIIHFRSAKVQGLLIYVALTAPKTHERDVLAALFWPDDPEKTAKRNLRQSLYRLRRLLGDMDAVERPFLLITRTSVQFNPASKYSLDVADFSAAMAGGQLETAVALYSGASFPSPLQMFVMLSIRRQIHCRCAPAGSGKYAVHTGRTVR